MKTYLAFIEWFQCSCGCQPSFGIARLFEEKKPETAGKLAEFELAEDGMPNTAWAWMCNIEHQAEAKTILVKAAIVRPPVGSLRCLKASARMLGAQWLTWERLDEATGKLESKTFPTFHPAEVEEEPSPTRRFPQIEIPESKIENN